MTEPLYDEEERDRPRPAAAGPVKVRVPAKINLHLGVGPLRSDGYHELTTVYHAVSLFDELTARRGDTLVLTMDGEGAGELALDETNLVLRAARALASHTGMPPHARLHLRKQIPLAAGLAGGSADAAAALVACDALWGTGLSREELASVAAELGSDVPFFLGLGRAVGTGRGERLRALTSGGGLALVLVNPNFPLSTAEVYGRVPAGWRGAAKGTAEMVDALRGRSVRRVAAALTNTLEGLVEPAVPAIGRMKAALLAAGALGAVMSGSGPTVFGVARSLDHAQSIRRRVNRAGWSCWAVRSLSGPAIRAR